MRATKDETGSLCSLGKGDEVEFGEVDDRDRPAMGDRATVVATMVAGEHSGAIFVAATEGTGRNSDPGTSVSSSRYVEVGSSLHETLWVIAGGHDRDRSTRVTSS
jgi:hypothetical protein